MIVISSSIIIISVLFQFFLPDPVSSVGVISSTNLNFPEQLSDCVSSGDDINSDGINDIAISGNNSNIFLIFLNDRIDPPQWYKSYTKIGIGTFTSTIATTDAFGSSVSLGHDVNGDGIPDVAVGAMNDGSPPKGAVYVLLLSASGGVKSFSKISAKSGTITPPSLSDYAQFGSSVWLGPDVNYDGYSDMVVGAPNDNGAKGSVYMVYLSGKGAAKSFVKISDSETPSLFGVLIPNMNFGYSVSYGVDANNDGYADIAVGAPGTDNGNVFILFQDSPQSTDLKNFMQISKSSPSGMNNTAFGYLDYFGSSIVLSSSLDDDPNANLILGASHDSERASNAGALHLLSMSSDASVVRANTKVYGESSNSFLGTSMCLVGDKNGDGSSDLLSVQMDPTSNRFTLNVLFTTGLDINECALKLHSCDANSVCSNTVGSFTCACKDGYVTNAATGACVLSDAYVLDAVRVSTSTGGGSFTATLRSYDMFGSSVCVGGDVNGDGVADVAVGSPSSGNNVTGNVGCVYLLFMNSAVASGSMPTIKSYSKISLEASGVKKEDLFGVSVGLGKDINGDGVADLAVGAMGDNNGHGAVYVVFLSNSGNVKSFSKITSKLTGVSNFENFGASVCLTSDMNNDAVADLVVGLPNDSDGSSSSVPRGTIFLVFLKSDGSAKSFIKIGSSTYSRLILADNGLFGSSVSYGLDINGDNNPDLVVGNPHCNDGGIQTGCVHVLFMSAQLSVVSFSKIAVGTFTAALKNGEYFGISVSLVNDITNDGIPDLIVGASGDLAVYVIALTQSATVKSFVKISPKWSGLSSVANIQFGDAFGSAVWGSSDFNRDGWADIVVGAPGISDGGSTGSGGFLFLALKKFDFNECLQGKSLYCKKGVCENTFGSYSCTCTEDYAVSGVSECVDSSLSTISEILLKPSDVGFDANSAENQLAFGDSLCYGSSAGTDINDDGFADLSVGSPLYSSGAGAVFVIFMHTWYHGSANHKVFLKSYQKISANQGGFTADLGQSHFGAAVSMTSDVNSDATPDLVVGAPLDSAAGTQRGCVYVLMLSSKGTVNSHSKILPPAQIGDYSWFGSSVSVGPDVDKDGIADVAIGAEKYGSDDTGAVFLVYLNKDGSAKTISMLDTSSLSSSVAFGYLGSSISFGPDVNNDGYADIAVGASKSNGGQGAAAILFMSEKGSSVKSYIAYSSSTSSSLSSSTKFTGFREGFSSGASFGSEVAFIPDADNNGVVELVVSSQQPASVYILYLATDGYVSSYNKISSKSPIISNSSIQPTDNFGSSVWIGNDLDGNGCPDMIVGASGTAQGSTPNVGDLHIYLLSGLDSNECTQGTHNCDYTSICTNTLGSFTCTSTQPDEPAKFSEEQSFLAAVIGSGAAILVASAAFYIWYKRRKKRKGAFLMSVGVKTARPVLISTRTSVPAAATTTVLPNALNTVGSLNSPSAVAAASPTSIATSPMGRTAYGSTNTKRPSFVTASSGSVQTKKASLSPKLDSNTNITPVMVRELTLAELGWDAKSPTGSTTSPK